MNARTVHVAPERLERWLDGFAAGHGPVRYDVSPDLVTASAQDGSVARVTVPFPPLEPGTSVIEHALRDRRIGVLLVRRGGYAAGVFDAGKLISSKVGSRHVQGTTKAGGWSQQRFARRRENQAREAFGAAADAASRILGPVALGLDVVVCGGDRKAVDTVLRDPRLARLAELVRPPFLAVPDPRQRVLERAGGDARAVRVDVREPDDAGR